MAEKMDVKKKVCLTHEFRVSFPAIFEPKGFQGQEPKYSIEMLFDKKIDLGKPTTNKKGEPLTVSMKEAVMNAANEKWGSKDKWPKGLRLPFRDGDEEKSDTQGYQNVVFVKASNKKQPGLVDGNLKPILNEKEFYAGCYARAEVIAFAYDVSGNKGVSFSLQNIQKTHDGDAFGGKRKAEDIFESVEDVTSNSTPSDSFGF